MESGVDAQLGGACATAPGCYTQVNKHRLKYQFTFSPADAWTC